MTNCQKRRQSNSTDSVMGKLMGIDELPQKPFLEKYRALSETYVRNAASVGIRPGSLVANGLSSRRPKNEIVHEMKGETGLRISKGKNDDIFDKCVNPSTSKMKKCLRNQKRVLRFLQKYDQFGGLDYDCMKNSLENHLDTKDKPGPLSTSISAIKPNSNLEDLMFDRHSRTGYSERMQFIKRESGKRHVQLTYKEVDGTVSCRHSCSACTRTMNRFFRQERHRSKFDDLLRTGYIGFEQFPGVNDTVSSNSIMSESSSSYFSSSAEAYVRGVQDEIVNDIQYDICKETELYQRNSRKSISNSAAQCINDVSAEAFNIGLCNRTNGDLQLESIPFTLSGEIVHSSYVRRVSGEEAIFNEYSEEESSYSNSSGVGPSEFHGNLKRTYQMSPDSVLEPFDVQNLSTSKHFDSTGLKLQLLALNFDSEDTYSEGSSMLVSGDDDFSEFFEDPSHDKRYVKTWLADNKSRNYSYVVDVLGEARFCGSKPFIDFKTWHSPECPISPSVFEALEVKYGNQKSWRTCERRLLFDRINSCLVRIYNPIVDDIRTCATSIISKTRTCLTRDEAEDELWTMLMSEEKEASKDLSEKAFDKWFEFEEGVDIVCGELEIVLFDELTMELVT